MSYKKRPNKFDRLANPKASRADDLAHHIVGPFDAMSADMDRKWGNGRLADLVTSNTAEIWATTMANLNGAIRACYDAEDEKQSLANLKACVESGLRGFEFMDAEAERLGKPKANTDVWEYELNGAHIGIMADSGAWRAVKAERPDLRLFSMREAAVALLAVEASPAVAAIKERFPDATVSKIKPNPPVDYVNGGDSIPF